MKSKVTVTKLRRKYPHPRRACDALSGYAEGEYCVAGSVCLEFSPGQNFPSNDQVAEAITKATGGQVTCYEMSNRQHEDFHAVIAKMTAANDAGDFETAWTCLDALLKWECDGSMQDLDEQL